MPTRNVVLTDHQAKLIEGLVASGRFQNASEVLREGLRLLERAEGEYRARLEALTAAAQLGIADVEQGRYREFGAPDELGRYLAELADEALSPGHESGKSRGARR